MERFIKRLMSLMIICTMTFVSLGVTAFTGPAYAASKPVLSRKTITVKKGSCTTLTLKNARKKVVWKSSNSRLVKIIRTKGKYRGTVKIKGLRKGTAYITAKLGKKSYKCKVTVKYTKPQPDPAEIAAITDFSIDIFKKVSAKETAAGNNGSVLVSPDSIETALAMLEVGAAGETLEEMQAVLSKNVDRETFCSFLGGMNDRLEGSEKIIFQQANSIWARNGLMKVHDSFLQQNRKYFDAEYYEAPFDQETVDNMNNWVKNNTRDMIPKIIDELSEEDRLVLINTTVFEGEWASRFEIVKDESFTNAVGTKENASMLHASESYNYFKMNGAKCFERKYMGGEISFIGILPPEGTSVDDFVQNMSGSDLRSAWKSKTMKPVELTMPEFRYDYGTDLEDVLQSMGIEKAFSMEADLSAMGEPSTMVDRVIHKTHIELDRNGTKAAAATAVITKESSAYMESPIEIRMDRPFVYALVDTATGITLFIGTVKTLK